MNDVKRLAKLREKVATMQRDADKSHGRLEQVLGRIKEEFECEDLDEARALLKKLQDEREAKNNKFSKAMAKFQKKWGDSLE